jgi:uncharacterized membrane protein YkvI
LWVHYLRAPVAANVRYVPEMSEPIHRSPVLWWGLFVLFAALGAYALLNTIASASLACVSCDCIYTLTAENPRCRWPAIWALLFFVALAVALVSAVLAILGHRRRNRQNSSDAKAHT